MMKRSNKESVLDALASKDLYVSVSTTPDVTKVVWHIDPSTLAENGDGKRKSPESMYLQLLSAVLTGIVLWGIFWQIHNHLIPQLFYRSAVTSSFMHDSSSLALAKMQANANAFVRGDLAADLAHSSVGVGAKHLLEVSADQIADPQENHVETSWGGSLWPVLHRKFLAELSDHDAPKHRS